MNGTAQDGFRRWLSFYAAGAFAFLYLPLLILSAFSFNSSKFTVWEGFSVRWYQAAFTDPQFSDAAWNSLIIAVAATVISTVIGTCCAYGLWKRGAPVLLGSLYLTLVTPEIVTGVSLLAFYQAIFRFAHFRLGMHTVILAHVAFSIAYVVVVVAARLRTIDPRLEEAALEVGVVGGAEAREREVLRRLHRPLAGGHGGVGGEDRDRAVAPQALHEAVGGVGEAARLGRPGRGQERDTR